MNNNQCHAEQSFLRSHQLLSYSLNSLSSTQHISSLLFSLQPHSHPPTQFLQPTHLLFSHIFFIEQHSYYGPHVQCTSNTMLTHQNEGQTKWDIDKSSNPLCNAPVSNWYKQHLMKLQPPTSPTLSQTTLLNSNNQTINLIHNDKHNPPKNNKHNRHTITNTTPHNNKHNPHTITNTTPTLSCIDWTSTN